MLLNITNNSNRRRRQVPTLHRPFLVGYMSVDRGRNYHSDLSQIKYVTKIPQHEISYNLNHNIESAVKRTTDDNNEKINLLLQFILDQKKRLSQYCNNSMFITYRRTLISVMCNAVNPQPLRIAATLYNGEIYLCSLETSQESERRRSRSDKEYMFCAWGYKFEQYLLSDRPDHQPDITKPVVENEEFSLYYRTNFGQHALLYGAQIDGVNAINHTTVPPEANNVENAVEYLRNCQFIELKTNREFSHYKQEINFRRNKLLRCWCQCYLADLVGLLVGFRNDAGIVHRLQWYTTAEIVSYCKNEWTPEKPLNFLNYFLTYVKNCFRQYEEANPNSREPLSIEIEIDERNVIRHFPCSNTILPDWFINK